MKVSLRQSLWLATAAAFMLAAFALTIVDRWKYVAPAALGMFPIPSAKRDYFEAISGLKKIARELEGAARMRW